MSPLNRTPARRVTAAAAEAAGPVAGAGGAKGNLFQADAIGMEFYDELVRGEMMTTVTISGAKAGGNIDINGCIDCRETRKFVC
jgi:hypothetical protein